MLELICIQIIVYWLLSINLLVIARYIEKLIISIEEIQANWLYKILINISGVRQKIRTGRHYPRRSMKPSLINGEILSCVKKVEKKLNRMPLTAM